MLVASHILIDDTSVGILAPSVALRGAERMEMETQMWEAFQACPEVLQAHSEPDPPVLAGRTGRVRKQVGISQRRG